MSHRQQNIVSECVRNARRAARSSRFSWRSYLYSKKEYLSGFPSSSNRAAQAAAASGYRPRHHDNDPRRTRDSSDNGYNRSTADEKLSWREITVPPIPVDVLSSATTYDSLFRASSAGALDDLEELQQEIKRICTPVVHSINEISMKDVGITEQWLRQKYSAMKTSGNLSWMVPQKGSSTVATTQDKPAAGGTTSPQSASSRADGDAIIEEATSGELEDIDNLERYIENHVPTLTRRHRNEQHIGYIPILEEYPRPSFVADSDSDTSESEGNSATGDPVTMGIFILPPGTSLPLHDHPGMCVVSKVLYGSLHLRNYDLCTHQGQMFPHLRSPSLGDVMPAKPGEPVNVASEKYKKSEDESSKRNEGEGEEDDDDIGTLDEEEEYVDTRRFAKFKNGYIVPQGSSVCLTPLRGNIHSLSNYQHSSPALSGAVASNEPCVVLDVLFPPYDFQRHRACTYYDEFQSTSSRDVTFLKAIPTPSDLDMDEFEYKGLSPHDT